MEVLLYLQMEHDAMNERCFVGGINHSQNALKICGAINQLPVYIINIII